jgi:hypothetical protein
MSALGAASHKRFTKSAGRAILSPATPQQKGSAMRRLIVVVALLSLACGGSSPTAPGPTTTPPPTQQDALAACGVPLTNQQDTATRTVDTGARDVLGITNINPRNDAGKAFVRLTWQSGLAPISFRVTAQSVDSSNAYTGQTIATSTPESATSATACWSNPVAVDTQVLGTVTPGTYTITVLRSYPQR